MQFNALFFDLDGTLIDSPMYWHAAYNKALVPFEKELTDQQFRSLYPTGAHISFWLSEIGIDEQHIDDIRTMRDEHYVDMLHTDTQWIEGARELLLSQKGVVPTGIITGSHRSYIDALDKSLGVSDLVDIVLTTEDFSSKAHALQICSDHFSVDLKDSIYIGDQPFDEEGAQKTSTPFAVFRGDYTPQSLLDSGYPIITSWAEWSSML